MSGINLSVNRCSTVSQRDACGAMADKGRMHTGGSMGAAQGPMVDL